MRDIKLSQKHGLNPSLMICRLCGESTGVALLGRMKDDAEAPRHIPDEEPCKKCLEQMTQGFLIIEATQGSSGSQLTGRRWIIKQEAAERMFDEEFRKRGACYIEPEMAEKIGLTKFEGEGE